MTYRAWNLKTLDRAAVRELTHAIAEQNTEELEYHSQSEEPWTEAPGKSPRAADGKTGAQDAPRRRGVRGTDAGESACEAPEAPEKHKFRLFTGDRVLWIIVAALAVISVLVVYSSTAKMAYDAHTARTTAHFLRQQLIILVVSLIIMDAEQKINCRINNQISRPDYLEAEAVSRLLRIAQAADAPVIIVHTTNRASLDEIAAARRRGQTVYVETCPQYLALDDGVYYAPAYSSAARYVCAPPIRSQEDSEALWKALRRGEVQTISTDHCSFTLEQKDMGRDDFTKIPGGLPGVETRGEVVYTVAINENKLSLGGVCRALSENPAKLYGLYPRKGVIAAGSDADIVVYDPGASHVLHGADMLSKAGYTPFEGFRTNGGVSKVYLRGQLQVDGGKVGGGKMGEYLKRGKCAL